MKKCNHFISILFLLYCTLPVLAQNMVDAGKNQSIYCNESVQLNATPMNGWSTMNTYNTTGLTSIYFNSVDSGIAVGNIGTIMKTYNGGNMWFQGPTLSPNSLYSVYFFNKTIGFITGSSGIIFKTTDGGNTWSPQISGTTCQLRSVYFTSATTGYIGGTEGTILKTTNGGTTWVPLVTGSTSAFFAIKFISPEIGYAAGSQGTVLKTTNAGITWTSQTTGTTSLLNSISFPTPTSGYITGVGGTILKTTDGSNWGVYTADNVYMGSMEGVISKTTGRLLKASNLNSVCFTSATTGYIGGSYGSGSIFLKTIDAGVTWFELTSNVTSKITSLCFPTATIGYAAGGMGTIAKISNGEILPCTYSWYPAKGLSNPNIANPTAKPGSTTLYTVVANQGNNSFSDSVNVSVESLTVSMNPFRTIGCEGSILLDSVTTNYTGAGRLKYKWSPSTGLSSDTIANPIASVTKATVYHLIVTTPDGCTSSGFTTVTLGPLTVTPTADKTAICSGTVQLSAPTNYSGNSMLHYKWIPSTGLSNDSISNPVATVSSQTVYTVHVTSATGCTATESVTVKVSNLTANAGTDKTISCGQQVQLDSVITNYNGTGVLRYKWTPSTGLNNDTIANPVVTGGFISMYTVTVSAPSGCTATDNVNIIINPVTLNLGSDKTAACGTLVQLGVGSTNYTGKGLKYKWTPASGLNNDTIANPLAAASNITYSLTITTPSGCTATDNIAISILPMDKPTINYVGISQKNKNILAWTKPTLGKIISFNIFKETNVSNSYTKIGSVSVDSASVFVDASSNPNVQSNKYKISIVDACGNETSLSDYHKTMHLSINKGINTLWNLIWESYEGYSVSTYNIYRGTSPENIQIIGSLSGSNTQFSDYTAPAGYVYYQIEAVSSTATGVKQQNKSSVKSLLEAAYTSRSNIASNKSGVDGLNNLTDISNVLSIYPVPASNSIQLTIGEPMLKRGILNIYNSFGSQIITKELFQNTQEINVSNLSNGIYVLEVISDNYSGIKKLIIQK